MDFREYILAFGINFRYFQKRLRHSVAILRKLNRHISIISRHNADKITETKKTNEKRTKKKHD
jgi:hypothetical protein